ncbi:hypothetical protein OBBRIDRAFT_748654 [Obba rivulosa]|uniref:Uncharacterized protein n=1 Tax=Obba rivulosa TaxID=1052685 RepID=A0A8E2DQH0_9APHY|nr:hypothetical protein OBBRIDRAFT_748654 [Obba rivulosa]
MSVPNATAITVDDAAPSVVYSNGWVLDTPSSAEYNQTKHGATSAGLTATFKFTGTGVEVYGSLGSIDVYGRPVSSYSVDGVQQGTYQAPIINPGFAETNVLFFRSPLLGPTTHTLVVTNQNGTAPSTLWLDYFVYTPSDDTASISVSPSHASQSALSSGSISNPASASLSSTAQGSASLSSQSPTLPPTTSGLIQTTSSGSGASAASTSPVVASRTSKSHTGAIAGGVIGGVAALGLIAALLYFFQRRKNIRAEADINPFGSWREPTSFAESQKLTTPSHNTLNVPVAPDTPPLITTETPSSISAKCPVVLRPALTGLSSDPGSSGAPAMITLSETGPVTLQHNDSGVRLPRPVVEVPPAYSAD